MSEPVHKKRLSDHILEVLKQSMEQDRQDVSAHLSQALELSMKNPKSAGDGQGADERRDYPEEIESFLRIFDEMDAGKDGGY